MTIFYTGRGDKGKSEMGVRKIAKDDPVFEALGSLDELNSWLGFCKAGFRNEKGCQTPFFLPRQLFYQ